MPKQQLAFEPQGPKRLEIAWGLGWKNVAVNLDGREIGTIADQKALKEGRIFKLDDGSERRVQLSRSTFSTELHVLRNDKPLPGSRSDPATKLSKTYGVIFFVGGLSTLIGLLAVVSGAEFLQSFGGWFSAVFGLVFIGLGFMVKRRQIAALYVAIGLYALDALLLLVTAFSQPGGRAPTCVRVWDLCGSSPARRNPRPRRSRPCSARAGATVDPVSARRARAAPRLLPARRRTEINGGLSIQETSSSGLRPAADGRERISPSQTSA